MAARQLTKTPTAAFRRPIKAHKSSTFADILQPPNEHLPSQSTKESRIWLHMCYIPDSNAVDAQLLERQKE